MKGQVIAFIPNVIKYNENSASMIKNLSSFIAGFSLIIGLVPIFLSPEIDRYYIFIFRFIILILALSVTIYLTTKREKSFRIYLIPLISSFFFFLLSEIIEFVYVITSLDILSPIINVTSILAYTSIYIVLIRQIRPNVQYVSRNMKLVTLLITAFVVVMISPLLISFARYSIANRNFMELAFTIIFLIIELDIIAISFAFIYLNWKIEIPYFWLTILGAWFFIMVGDGSKLYFFTREIYYIGSIPDIFYNVGYSIFFVGIVIMIEQYETPISVHEIERERQYYQTLYEEISILVNDLVTVTSLLRHDLHNDVVVIQNSLELFLETEQEVFLEKLNHRIGMVINRLESIKDESDLLDSLKTQPIDISVIDDVANLFDDVVVISELKNVRLNASKLLYPILINLTQNAFEHGGENVKVEIEAEELNEFVLIKIKDDGRGIDDAEKDRIFNRSYNKDDYKGRGMGLFLVRIAIERYGGSIFLEDNEPKGAAFVIKLQKHTVQ